LDIRTLTGRSGTDEQEGYQLFAMGAIQAIRNPRGHTSTNNLGDQEALELLAVASVLMRRIDVVGSP